MKKLVWSLPVLFLAVALLAGVALTPDISVTVRPGSWADVAASPAGDVTFVRVDGHVVIAERPNGAQRWRVELPEDTLYLRTVADPSNRIEAVVQGHDSGNAYVVTEEGFRKYADSFGQNAVAVGWTPGAGFTYYAFTSPTQYAVFNGAGCAPCTVITPQTSQGFRDVTPSGLVRLGDANFTDTFNGRRLWQYATRSGVTVGQCDPAAICMAAEGRTFTVVPGDGFEPHLVAVPVGFYVATRTTRGAAFARVTAPYPPADVATVPPPPPPPPPPGVQAAAVTVDKFTLTPKANLPDGTVFEIHDPNNPQLATRVRAWVDGGSIFFSIDYPGAGAALLGRTGARRPVR